MADPSTTSGSAIAGTAAKSAGSGTLTAALLPLDPATMAVGLVGALWGLLHTTPKEGETRPPLRIFALVATSGFLAGVVVPVVVAGGINYIPWLAGVSNQSLQLTAAFLFGAAPHIGPSLWRAWRATKGGE